MDLWVIAAAAGAGCIVKNLQNFSSDKKESPRGPSFKYSNNFQTESRNFLQQLRDKTCPLRRLAQKSVQDDVFLDLENHSDDARVSESDTRVRKDSFKGDYANKTAVLEVGVGDNEQVLDGENMNLSKFGRMRRGHLHSIRPLSSLESCVDNTEHSPCLYPSLSPSRPVLFTDASWGESPSSTQPDARLKETRRGRQFESLEEFKKPKKGSNGVQSSPSQGTETMRLFIIGMTIGILSATSSGKNKVDKLNTQLKQMQGLVQDLHEELNLKETVMVKELDTESNLPTGEGDSIKEPISSPSVVKAENLELLSRIEAELQAELEMLEQNLKINDQDRISGFVEFDPDFELEIVLGELKPSMVEAATDSETKTTDTATECSKPANYAIPPWELSLKLHELIESRLKTRIQELEIALLHSQNRVAMQHSVVSERRYSYSETESSSTHHSPTCICRDGKMDDEGSDNDEESGSNGGDRRARSSNGIPNGAISVVNSEDSMSEDESEMLLIKQIIERRKSGSSFNFSID